MAPSLDLLVVAFHIHVLDRQKREQRDGEDNQKREHVIKLLMTIPVMLHRNKCRQG
jgi:hypothetical protein